MSGCAGYTLGPSKPTIMAGVESIGVPIVENQTYLPRVETLTTTAIIRHFQTDGTYRIESPSVADATLFVVIEAVNRAPARSIRGNVLGTSEFFLEVVASYRLIRERTGQEIMAGSVRGTTSFFVTGEIVMDQEQAFPYAAEQVAKEIVNRISEGW